MFHHLIFILIHYCVSNTFSFQSYTILGDLGTEFSPVNMNALCLDTRSAITSRECAYACHQNFECRTFNFDENTRQCQLFEGDTVATGSIIQSSSSTSVVGSIELLETDFNGYGQPCDRCSVNRFLRCVNGVCDCQQHTYWNGNVCLPQLPVLCAACQQNKNMCRTDLGLTCQSFNKCDCKLYIFIEDCCSNLKERTLWRIATFIDLREYTTTIEIVKLYFIYVHLSVRLHPDHLSQLIL
jgi:PAN domain